MRLILSISGNGDTAIERENLETSAGDRLPITASFIPGRPSGLPPNTRGRSRREFRGHGFRRAPGVVVLPAANPKLAGDDTALFLGSSHADPQLTPGMI
jgi:hypothetical protein